MRSAQILPVSFDAKIVIWDMPHNNPESQIDRQQTDRSKSTWRQRRRSSPAVGSRWPSRRTKRSLPVWIGRYEPCLAAGPRCSDRRNAVVGETAASGWHGSTPRKRGPGRPPNPDGSGLAPLSHTVASDVLPTASAGRLPRRAAGHGRSIYPRSRLTHHISGLTPTMRRFMSYRQALLGQTPRHCRGGRRRDNSQCSPETVSLARGRLVILYTYD
jgi:hypothetical protein